MNRITDDIDLIVSELHSGNVVALPTETVYGLGADAANELAINKVFKIKARPMTHPLIMHVGHDWDLSQWVEHVPNYASKLIKEFWPGPLTFVFKLRNQSNINPLITGNQNTIAIRCPAHPLMLQVLKKFNRPIVAPSANPFGKISPTEAGHVINDFPQHPFLILEGGSCDIGIESTILDATNEDRYLILRHGVISQFQLEKFCDSLAHVNTLNSIRVSGNLKCHYQPSKPLFYFDKKDAIEVEIKFPLFRKSYLLCFSNLFEKEIVDYVFPSCPKKAAREFYRQLRLADKSNEDSILIELPNKKPEWEALIDRIKKAGIDLFG